MLMKKFIIVIMAFLYSFLNANMVFAGADTWTRKSDLGSSVMESLYGAFTNAGIWQWDGSIWSKVTPNDPVSIVVGY